MASILSAPVYSYHLGGSTGGRQSLVEAQRYPDDFDRIYSSAPAYNETGITGFSIAHLSLAGMIGATFEPDFTEDDVAVLEVVVLARCDGLDGVVDGTVALPRLRQPAVDALKCNGTQTIACLNETAVAAFKAFYTGPINNVTGDKLNLESVLLGSESTWASYLPVDSLPGAFSTLLLPISRRTPSGPILRVG